jgi:hypothetical protein
MRQQAEGERQRMREVLELKNTVTKEKQVCKSSLNFSRLELKNTSPFLPLYISPQILPIVFLPKLPSVVNPF